VIGVLKKVFLILEFVAFFLRELVTANIRLAFDTLRPARDLRPGVVAVPLDVTTDWQIMILSNLITLTPGSLSLDVSQDRRTIYVHTMDASDLEAARRHIKQGFERRIKELFS
jgi:multicomponent Na+:H+ antiporter subunit E